MQEFCLIVCLFDAGCAGEDFSRKVFEGKINRMALSIKKLRKGSIYLPLPWRKVHEKLMKSIGRGELQVSSHLAEQSCL
jgi:hypothetical protein